MSDLHKLHGELWEAEKGKWGGGNLQWEWVSQVGKWYVVIESILILYQLLRYHCNILILPSWNILHISCFVCLFVVFPPLCPTPEETILRVYFSTFHQLHAYGTCFLATISSGRCLICQSKSFDSKYYFNECFVWIFNSFFL